MNADGKSQCVNCSSPLLPSSGPPLASAPPMRGSGEITKATMRSAWLVEQLRDDPPLPTYALNSSMSHNNEAATKPCVDATCGYPVRLGAAICPRCGTTQAEANRTDEQQLLRQQLQEANARISALESHIATVQSAAQQAQTVPDGLTPNSGAVLALQLQLSESNAKVASLEALVNRLQSGQQTPKPFTIPDDVPNRDYQQVGHTINPFIAQHASLPVTPVPAIPAFRLVGLAADGTTEIDESQDFEGAEVLLDRSNLAPDNLTLSLAAHCRIYHDGESWAIQDLSTHRATFRRLDEATALEHGDVLLLGDRLFRFEERE